MLKQQKLNQAQEDIMIKDLQRVVQLNDLQAREILTQFQWSLQRATNHVLDIQKSGLKVEEQFKKYITNGQQIIDENGIISFCKDLGIDIMDPVILYISYLFKSETMGIYTKFDFLYGFQQLGVQSTSDLKRELKRLRDDLKNNKEILKAVYKYCFDFAKKKNRKDIDLPIAQGLWDTLLTNTFPIMKKFMSYVGTIEEKDVKPISRDTYYMVWEFCVQIGEDLTKYDYKTGAWPTFIDEQIMKNFILYQLLQMNDDMTENDVDCQTFDLYQIKNSDSQSMGLKKVETQIENQNSDPLLYQRTLFINEELLEVEKEKIDKNIYEIGIIFEEIIYLIIIQCIECKFDIFIYPKYQLDHINQYLVLKYIFKIHTTPEQIRNQINKAKNYIQKDNEHLQKMARVWFDLNKFKQNGEDLLNYFDAFEIMNTMFKQQSQIFADFLMFLAERYYQSEVIITSELYNQILQTFFPLRNNDQIEHPFIQEFFNAKQNIYD